MKPVTDIITKENVELFEFVYNIHIPEYIRPSINILYFNIGKILFRKGTDIQYVKYFEDMPSFDKRYFSVGSHCLDFKLPSILDYGHEKYDYSISCKI